MLALTDYKSGYSPELFSMVQKFINERILEALLEEIDTLRDADEDYYELLFPRSYLARHTLKECFHIAEALRDRLASDVEYVYFSPLFKYILYHVLNVSHDFYLDCLDLGDVFSNVVLENDKVKLVLPDNIKEKIMKEFGIKEIVDVNFDADDFNEGLCLIKLLEDYGSYTDFISDDLDFLGDSLRAIVELALTNSGAFLSLMSYEELDTYVDIMPLDIVDDYKRYREAQKKSCEDDYKVTAVLDSIINALQALSRRTVVHKDKGEVELTAELQERIEPFLDTQNIRVAREYTLGRAKKGLGETDLYITTFENGRAIDIAVLENKVLEKFDKQYLQLMGYLNPNFLYGITLSINKNMKLSSALNYIKDKLQKIEGDFAPVHIFDGKGNLPLIISDHQIPETGKLMPVYHFVLNLYDKEREEAALKARS